VKYEIGMTVRLKMTDCLYEVKEIKDTGQLAITNGLMRLIVSPEQVLLVPALLGPHQPQSETATV
jgi:hypothetical protein